MKRGEHLCYWYIECAYWEDLNEKSYWLELTAIPVKTCRYIRTWFAWNTMVWPARLLQSKTVFYFKFEKSAKFDDWSWRGVEEAMGPNNSVWAEDLTLQCRRWLAELNIVVCQYQRKLPLYNNVLQAMTLKCINYYYSSGRWLTASRIWKKAGKENHHSVNIFSCKITNEDPIWKMTPYFAAMFSKRFKYASSW